MPEALSRLLENVVLLIKLQPLTLMINGNEIRKDWLLCLGVLTPSHRPTDNQLYNVVEDVLWRSFVQLRSFQKAGGHIQTAVCLFF